MPVPYSPAKEMRLRVLNAGVDTYGLNAYLFDSTNDGVVNYDRLLFAHATNGAAAVATLRRGEWGDVKVKIVGGGCNDLTSVLWLKVEELTADVAHGQLPVQDVEALARSPLFKFASAVPVDGN